MVGRCSRESRYSRIGGEGGLVAVEIGALEALGTLGLVVEGILVAG